jgi:hypothetical protein
MATHDAATPHRSELASTALANLSTKIWRHVIEPDAQSAADFLNLPPAQIAGEGMVSNRADGSVDVYYFL